MKKLFLLVCAAVCVMTIQAQNITKDGGLTMQQINALRGSFKADPANKALRNAINSNDISKLAAICRTQCLPKPSPIRNLPVAAGCSRA